MIVITKVGFYVPPLLKERVSQKTYESQNKKRIATNGAPWTPFFLGIVFPPDIIMTVQQDF